MIMKNRIAYRTRVSEIQHVEKCLHTRIIELLRVAMLWCNAAKLTVSITLAFVMCPNKIVLVFVDGLYMMSVEMSPNMLYSRYGC